MFEAPICQRPGTRVTAAIAGSLLAHLSLIGVMSHWAEGSAERSAPTAAPVELVELPQPPEPPPEPDPPEAQPEEQELERQEPAPRKTRRIRRPLLAARGSLETPAKTSPLPAEPAPRGELPTQPIPIPAQLYDLDPSKAARDYLLRGQQFLDEEEQMAQRVQERSDGIMQGALAPLPNDRSTFPELARDADGNLTWHRHGMTAKIRPDGTVDFAMGRNPGGSRESRLCRGQSTEPGACRAASTVEPLPGIAPPIDLNDLAAMAHGDDPRAAWKRWFLRQTEELRDQMAERNRRQVLAKAPSAVDRNLGRIWSDSRLSGPAKRLLLFRLWDECEESHELDDERLEASVGQNARNQIVGFIRQKAPPGSRWAFTPGEIRILNRRRESRQPFDPY